MLPTAEQEPHFEREARILTLPYYNPCREANSATRWGRVAFAAVRSCSISLGVICAALLPSAPRCANFSLVAKIHSRREARNSSALAREAYGGNDRRTSPEGFTDNEIRLERRVQQIVTSPTTSSLKTSFIAELLANALTYNLKKHYSRRCRYV